MVKCRNTSVENCLNCSDYACKNLYGPIKSHSRCFDMIKDKLFDECVFGCENENDLNGCSCCAYRNVCSTLIGEAVDMLDI